MTSSCALTKLGKSNAWRLLRASTDAICGLFLAVKHGSLISEPARKLATPDVASPLFDVLPQDALAAQKNGKRRVNSPRR
jgi:hypothetical protein